MLSITVKPKPDKEIARKEIARKESYRPISLMNKDVSILNKNIDKSNSTKYKNCSDLNDIPFIGSPHELHSYLKCRLKFISLNQIAHNVQFKNLDYMGQAWWCMPEIPAMWEA
jgi:hypothetical protein